MGKWVKLTHFGLKRYLLLLERLGEYSNNCKIIVFFLRGVEMSKIVNVAPEFFSSKK